MIFGQESETLEFKKTTAEAKDAVVDVAAILNKHGRGELYFGIKNDGTVKGQTVSVSSLRDVGRALTENIKPQIYPTVEKVNIDYKDCIRVQFEGMEPPYFAHGRAYIRVADESKQLSPAELERFFKRKQGQLSTWDTAPSGKTIEDVNTNTLRSYMKKANDSGRLEYRFTDREDILNRLELLDDGNPNNTAIAMFGKKGIAEIQMAIFATDVKHTFIDIDRKKGAIIDLVDAGELYIRKNIRWRVVRDGAPQRTEVPEVPIEAVREALLNSYAHKDWQVPQTNEIAIYSNRIEIYNPGTFPEGLMPQDFIDGVGKSIRRNPQLAQIMYYSKDIESFGTGLRKIAIECEGAGVRYGFELGKLGFSVIFYRPNIYGEAAMDSQVAAPSGSQAAVKRQLLTGKAPSSRILMRIKRQPHLKWPNT
ncbi:MAG: putative DNA binding domain-containing protein [Coriobacteriales bacterium]|jgi:ATP-dependent DNA helicase RecG|nr:putative DNA binding domain-containing protein [Coriobacteriales bacterium]